MAAFDFITQSLQPFYLRMALALIIILLGLICGQLLSKIVKRLLTEIQLDKLVRKATGLRIRLELLLSSFIKYFIYFVFILWALERVGLGSIVLNILAGGVMLLVIISILLGIKDFVPNVVAGTYLQFKGIVKQGDYIKCQNVEGTVKDVDIVKTQIETRSKDIIYIPNSTLLKNLVVKKS